MDPDRIYGVQQFVVFAVLAHLPLVVAVSIPPALLAVWYVSMGAVAVLAVVTNLGWPALAREYEAELGVLELFCCGVGCAVVTALLLRMASPTPYTYGLAAVAGVAALVLVGAGILPYLRVWRR